ncbi:MAG: MORN motif-containing protein, partial [Proteobacteria bacterium]|nr:MORN motif-containing protein [Pseudomonadota bacterium]
GQGTFTYSNGEKYVGEWKDDKLNGKGTFTWSDGGKYVGKFKDGECHGQGTFSSKDGEKFVGEWKDDEEWNITEYDKNGIITGKWVNGVKQK